MKSEIDFVNKGKPFDIPRMDIETHEAVMDIVSQKFNKLTEVEFNRKFNKYLVSYQLNKIDDSKSVDEYYETILKMHPDDFIELFKNVWGSGKRENAKFREEKR